MAAIARRRVLHAPVSYFRRFHIDTPTPPARGCRAFSLFSLADYFQRAFAVARRPAALRPSLSGARLLRFFAARQSFSPMATLPTAGYACPPAMPPSIPLMLFAFSRLR